MKWPMRAPVVFLRAEKSFCLEILSRLKKVPDELGKNQGQCWWGRPKKVPSG